MTGEQFGFGRFAEQSFYQRVNQWLVESINPRSGQRIVDLACGTGLLTRLILERLRGARDTVIIGIDQSGDSLRQAMENVKSVPGVMVELVQTQVEHLSTTLRGAADTIVLGNGIHLIPDKKLLIGEVFACLRPGGTFAFNSTFFEGGVPPESEAYYRRWMSKAIRNLKSTYGLMPTREKVQARRQLTPAEYREHLEQQGFTVTKQELIPVEFPLEGHLTISKYDDFVAGALPGVPLEMASQVLQEAARQSYKELNLTVVPRYWLQMVAVRPVAG